MSDGETNGLRSHDERRSLIVYDSVKALAFIRWGVVSGRDRTHLASASGEGYRCNGSCHRWKLNLAPGHQTVRRFYIYIGLAEL